MRVLECVVNVSEGRDHYVLDALASSVAEHMLDVHSDHDHNRSVFTLIGEQAPRHLAIRAMQLMNINHHSGVHPRIGIVDVVPFVPLFDSQWSDAVRARNDFSHWAATELNVPCFLYGDERTLPDIRRTAWHHLLPDTGPSQPHSTAGAMCVGARLPLIAYNVWLKDVDLATTKKIATAVRTESIRTLGLQVGEFTQVSINLVDPETSNPADAFDAVQQHVDVHHCELVGLLPRDVLQSIPAGRWEELDLAEDRTIEWRLEHR
jgi:glutamate formiminotransferase / 5-formyltetrahydrofolate cyclo-ligase